MYFFIYYKKLRFIAGKVGWNGHTFYIDIGTMMIQ